MAVQLTDPKKFSKFCEICVDKSRKKVYNTDNEREVMNMIELKYDELTNGKGLAYSVITGFDEQNEENYRKWQRRNDFSRKIVRIMQDRKVISWDDWCSALSWLDHSTKTVDEIIDIVFFGKGDGLR